MILKKTLFVSFLAMAADVTSSHAQSDVYSANIVGYVAVTNAASQYVMLANPMDNGTNDLTGLLPNVPNGAQVLVLTGGVLQPSSKTKGVWTPNFTINPGDGFYVNSPVTTNISQYLQLQ